MIIVSRKLKMNLYIVDSITVQVGNNLTKFTYAHTLNIGNIECLTMISIIA